MIENSAFSLEAFLERNKVVLGAVLIGAILFGGGILSGRGLSSTSRVSVSKEVVETENGEDRDGAVKAVTVHIAGAVTSPGVYELPSGSRVGELIERSGGFADDTDTSWVDLHLNLAKILVDEQKIYVPSVGEQVKQPVSAVSSTPLQTSSVMGQTQGKVNLNTASVAQLQALPGIGAAYSARIVEYRERIGGFKSVTEIQNVSGIGPKTFEELRDLITVN